MSTKLTDEERDSLSESELAAMEEDDDELVGNEPHLAAGDDDDDDVDVEALTAIAAGGEADPIVTAAVADATEPEFTPRFVAEPVIDADALLADISSRKDDLRAKLNDGDIGLDEFSTQHDALGKEERDIERRVWQAEESQRQNTQLDAQRWNWEQEQFFAAESNVAYKDKYLLTALDAAIKDLANDPANASKKGPWFLSEADKMIRSRFGVSKEAPILPGGKTRVTPPPTLGGMPSAELPETGAVDEFAHFDKLDQFALEAALAKLTPDQEARYLAGA